MSVLLETSVGDMVIDLYCDLCPITCKNFLKLCKIKYYNNCVFYYIEKDYVIQTGDPTNSGKEDSSVYGLLYGNQAKYFDDEIKENLNHAKKGTVAMANRGKNFNGSQFYITTADNLQSLDLKHTIFGMVAEGFETLDRINNANVNEDKRPVKVLRILHTIILEDPFLDPKGLVIPSRSPSPDERYFKDFLDEDLDMENLTEEDIKEELRIQDEKANAEILTLIGDIPDPDVKPPETVLFVCKLNPTTTGKSLAIPFSRFGKIISSEVIYDRHGNSLCYAFIEFEEKSACEEAFVKMQNVLIDDRRIHVDFSQSIGKTNWKRYGGWKKFFSQRAREINDRDMRNDNGGGSGELVLKNRNRREANYYRMVEDNYGYDMNEYFTKKLKNNNSSTKREDNERDFHYKSINDDDDVHRREYMHSRIKYRHNSYHRHHHHRDHVN